MGPGKVTFRLAGSDLTEEERDEAFHLAEKMMDDGVFEGTFTLSNGREGSFTTTLYH
jgi:hypothetical protein